jgi:ribonuclease P protein subunit RPR2
VKVCFQRIAHKLGASNKKTALQRIHRLFHLARNLIHENEELAQRCIAIARKISMASRTRIPKEYQRQICRGCKKFILPGVNCRVRIQQRREPHIVITCGYCGKNMRFSIKKEIGEKRKHDYSKNETSNKA